MDPLSVDEVFPGFCYTGFWARVFASAVDTALLALVTYPLLVSMYGLDSVLAGPTTDEPLSLLISWVLPIAIVVLCWIYKQATPGKMLIASKIVDAKTGGKPSVKQYFVRYVGYLLALVPLGLGVIWVAWDPRKQGWHDKMASTLVVRPIPVLESAEQY